MKIISKKKYNKLIEDSEELQKKIEELKRINESLGKKLEDKKTSCKMNNGKDFCFNCENSYRYKVYWGTMEYEKCGCLLDVPCESFERKENN
jgi:ABC-type Fe3+-citrate transport system substrate-binding protein